MADIKDIIGTVSNVGSAITSVANPLTAITGAIGALGSLFGLGGDSGPDYAEQYKYATKYYDYTRKGNMEDWIFQTNYERDYNTPEAVMNRMLAAGMNPNLAYQNANGWQSAQSSHPAAAGNLPLSSTLSGQAQMMQTYLNMMAQKANIGLMESQSRKNNAEADDKEKEVDAKDYITQFRELPRAQAKREISIANLNDTNSTVAKATQELEDQKFLYLKFWNTKQFEENVRQFNENSKLQIRLADIQEWMNHQQVKLMDARLLLDQKIGASQIALNGASAAAAWSLGALYNTQREGVEINNALIGELLGPVPEHIFRQMGLNPKDLKTSGKSFITWNELGNRLELLNKFVGTEGIKLSNSASEYLLNLQKYRFGDLSETEAAEFLQAISRTLFVLGINGNSLVSASAKLAK